MKGTEVSEVRTLPPSSGRSINCPDDGGSTYLETSVHFSVTIWRYVPEDSKLHTRRRENLKSHVVDLRHVPVSCSM
jgi:hypothetical protein